MVWIRGEHDITTRVHLSVAIAQAARRDHADVLVDLSGVTFMDASTIGAIVDARSRLRARSRSLSVRAPSRLARRLFDVCELACMIDEHLAPARPPVATALDSWVAVPASDRTSESPQPVVTRQDTSEDPARATVQRRLERTGSVQQRRSPS